jgi:hypothetical protein
LQRTGLSQSNDASFLEVPEISLLSLCIYYR